MTGRGKNAPKFLLVGMAAGMAAPASALRDPVATVARVSVVWGIAGVTVLVIAVRERRAKTGARAWETRLSVPNAKRWNAPKCRCANWLRKRTVKPWAA